MSRRQGLLLAGLVGLIIALGMLGAPPQLGPSTHGDQGEGLRALYLYLEARGVEVSRWERPLEDLPAADGSLLLAAPFPTSWSDADTRALRQWASQGGTVVLLLSGAEPSLNEDRLLDAFGLTVGPQRRDGPLWYPDWKQWRNEEAVLHAIDPALPEPLRMRRETHGPRLPATAEALYLDPSGQPMAWDLPWGLGRVRVLANPSVLNNAGLVHPENLASVDALLGTERAVRFDERHHGHLAAEALDLGEVLGPFELLVAHLGLIYLLGVWVLTRRFGPALVLERDRRGSVSRDLEVLASLHRRSGHSLQAGQRLLQLVAERARRRRESSPLPAHFEGGEAEFLALARQVGELQAQGRLP